MGKNKFVGLLLKIIFITSLTAGGIIFFKGKKTELPINNEKVLSAETKKPKPTEKPLLEIITSDPTVKKAVEYAQSTYKNVLGESTKFINSAVIKSAVSEIMKQVDKLPEKEKEEIKREICK